MSKAGIKGSRDRGAEGKQAAPTAPARKKAGRTLGQMFLPYQLAWINDESPRKLGDKSRRTGWTYCEAYDAVSRRFRRTRPVDRDYWFSSADESAAAEFIDYCRFFAKDLFGQIADFFTEAVEDPETKRGGTAYCIRTPNKRKIVGMTSNPRRFRSKGGDVCLDEFGFHDEARAMYAAASPVTTWGGTLRVFSTPNGEGVEYNRLVQRCRKVLSLMGCDPDRPPRDLDFDALAAAAREFKVTPVFSYHRVTIVDAIRQGIVETINRVASTTWTRETFLQDCREKSLDEESFQQEHMCVPGTDRAAWLTYLLVEACESDGCPQPGEPLTGYTGQACTVGVDVGRKHDLTVIWVLEWLGDVAWTRRVIEVEKTSLPEQKRILEGVLREVRWSSCLIDRTGIGLGLYEFAKERLGGRVEGIDFTNQAKHAIAVEMMDRFTDRSVRIPADNGVLRDDLHRVRKSTTSTGLVRFDADRDDTGHADRFWALGNALHAGSVSNNGHLWFL